MSTAIDFLRSFDADGWHNLVAIEPDTRAIAGKTIKPNDWATAQAFVDKWEGKRNLYFSVNEPLPNSADNKLGEDDMANIRAVYADVDPKPGDLDEKRAEIKTLAKSVMDHTRPTLVIDSGGGLQFFWETPKIPVDAQTKLAAKRMGRGIAHLVDGDGVCNIDRIMRLPGTRNLPDRAKLAKGRRIATAAVLDHRQDRYALEELARFYKPRDAEEGEDKDADIAVLQLQMASWLPDATLFSELPADLREKFNAACDRDPGLEKLWSGRKPPEDTSNSGWRFALVKKIRSEGGYSPEEFASLLYVWREHDHEKVTARNIARDWIRSGPGPEDLLDKVEGANSENLSGSKKYNFENFDDVVASGPATSPPLIKGLLDQGAMSVLYGDSNVGKTFVAMDMAFHIATGMRYAGMRTVPGLVVYVAAEGGNGARKRIVALRERFPDASPDFVLLSSPVDLRNPKADVVPLAEAIRALGKPVALIVIDTLSRAMAGGDENSPVDMGALIKHFDVLRKACPPAHLMTVHHTGKDKAKGARGHTALRAATDTELEVADGVVKATKQRDMDKDWSSGFKLRVHRLGIDSDGDPITSCTVDLITVGEARVAAAVPTEKERVVLTALLALSEGEGGVSSAALEAFFRDNVSEMTMDTVRFHLRALVAKKLVGKPKRGFWRVEVEENASSTSENRVPPVSEVEESGGKVEENIFG